jgi:TolB-like protein
MRGTKSLRLGLLVLGLLALAAAPIAAQQAKTFAVLPFTVNGPGTTYQHLGKGIQSMLNSRLTWLGRFESVDRVQLEQAKIAAPASEVEAVNAAKRAGADYLVYGSVTVVGGKAALDVQMRDKAGKPWARNADVGVDQIILELEKIAKDIRAEIFEQPGSGPKQAEKPQPQQAKPQGPKNPAFLAGQPEEGVPAPAGAVLNPQFRYEGGAESTGRWRSQNLNFPSRSFAVGDAAGEGKNQIFILGDYALHAYRYDGQQLKPLAEFPLSKRAESLRVSLLDLNHDGIPEIIVTSHKDDGPDSKILSFKGGKFEVLLDNIRLYLTVINTPPAYSPALVGQRRGNHFIFDSKDIHEYVLTGRELSPGKNIPAPDFANVFNMAYLPEEGGYKVVIVTDSSKLRVFGSDRVMQWTSEENYNSSGIGLSSTSRPPGMGPGSPDFIPVNSYVPMRLVPFSFDGRKYEVLTNKDLSVASLVFDKFRSFSQGELHSLFWDGVGLNLAWKTRRIKGTVVDFQIADLDNDGRKDLVVCVNTYPGVTGQSQRKTIIISYELNLQQQQ